MIFYYIKPYKFVFVVFFMLSVYRDYEKWRQSKEVTDKGGSLAGLSWS